MPITNPNSLPSTMNKCPIPLANLDSYVQLTIVKTTIESHK